jgi:hypothetical protein
VKGSPTHQADGCTIGVVHTPEGILFFKNRDLAGQYVADRLTLFHSTPEFHTLRGTDLRTGELAGVSIGVNRHRVCVANTHVLSTGDRSYDLLCGQLVRETRERDDVPKIVETFVAHNPMQGGRILVASIDWAFLVEVLGQRFEIQEVEGDVVITNTFSLLPNPPGRAEVRERSSATRLRVACEMLETVRCIGALKSMLRSHVPERGELSICNHRPDGGGTESSHILQIHGEYVSWSSLIGYPCGNDYHTVQLFQP